MKNGRGLDMSVLLNIALRNLKEHKAKSLIIGILIALGILILTIGNSILITANQGIKRTFIENFTGHVFVRTQAENPVSINGSFDPDEAGQSIPAYSELYDHVTSLPQVTSVNPQISSFGTLDFSVEGQNRQITLVLYGIEPENYLNMFPNNINMLEGRFLESGEAGIVVHKDTMEAIRNELDLDTQLGDEIKVSGFAGGSFRIRTLPLRGVYEYFTPNGNINAFVDATNMRSLVGMVVGTADVIDIDEEDTNLLDSVRFESEEGALFADDDLFGGDDLFGDDDGSDPVVSNDSAVSDGEEDIFSILGDLSERDRASAPDAGAWSYLLVKLSSDDLLSFTIEQLNAYFEENNILLEAVDWETASGGAAQTGAAIQTFFYILISILTVVAVIIIMNTLVVSIIERMKEIGTMRSLGAQKKVVRRMFVFESISISLVFGTIGLLLGLLVVALLNRIGIPAPNLFLQTLFGGDILRPVVNANIFILSYVIMFGIGIISSWYPVRVALRIQPLDAMQST